MTVDDGPDPELHQVDGPAGGSTYETPLTLGPDSDHEDPIRREREAAPARQPTASHDERDSEE
jgi:hypothetical protein